MVDTERGQTSVLIGRVERAALGWVKPFLMATTSKTLEIAATHVLAFRFGLFFCARPNQEDDTMSY